MHAHQPLTSHMTDDAHLFLYADPISHDQRQRDALRLRVVADCHVPLLVSGDGGVRCFYTFKLQNTVTASYTLS